MEDRSVHIADLVCWSHSARWLCVILCLTSVIPRCELANCDTVFKETVGCLNDQSSRISCSSGEIIVIHQASIAWTQIDQCPQQLDNISQCAETQDVSVALRQTCDYVTSCEPSAGTIGDNMNALAYGCDGVEMLTVKYLCLADYSPNDTGFIKVDTCDESTSQTSDVIQLSSQKGEECPCTMSLPAVHSVIYLSKTSDVTDACLSDVSVQLAEVVQTPSWSHDKGVLFDLDLCDRSASSELSISLGKSLSRCTVRMYLVGPQSVDLSCSNKTSTGAPEDEDEGEDDGGIDIVLIAAVVGGILVVVIIIAIVAIIWIRRSSSDAPAGGSTGPGAVDNTAMDVTDDPPPRQGRTHPWAKIEDDDRVYQINLDLSTSSQGTEDMVVVHDPNALYAKPD